MLIGFFISTLFGIESWVANKLRKEQQNFQHHANFFLNELTYTTEPEIFLTQKLLPAIRLILENRTTPQNLHSFYKKNWQIDLKIYQFSQNNKLIKKVPKRAPHLWLMKKLFPALQETNPDKLKKQRTQLNKKIQFAFGYGKELDGLRDAPESLIETYTSDKAGFFIWTKREQGGLILYCPKLPDEKQIFSAISKRIEVPAIAQKAGFFRYSGNFNPRNLPQKIYTQLYKQRSSSGFINDKYWIFQKTISGRIVYGSFSAPASFLPRLRELARLILLIFFLFGLILVTQVGNKNAISLKKLVISMFIASSVIPISGIVITTLDNLSVYREITTNKFRAVQEEILGNVVQNFENYLEKCSSKLIALTSYPGDGPNNKQTIQTKNNISDFLPDSTITIRDAGGEILFSNELSRSKGKEIVFNSMAHKMIERYQPQRLSEKKYSGNPFSDMLVSKDDMGLSTILNHPQKLQLTQAGTKKLMLFFRALPPTAGKAATINIRVSPEMLIKKYLKKEKEKVTGFDGIKIEFFALNPTANSWTIPPPKIHENQFLHIAHTSWASGQSVFEEITTGTEKGFALAMNSPELSGKCLIAYCSAMKMENTLQKMKKKAGIAALIAIFLLSTIGVWLSQQIIDPLKELETGVSALSQRDFTARLSIPEGKGEFSRLFLAFNEMMAESYDMQIAHSVQDGLVPKNFPEIPGYSLYGKLTPANSLGGDCLDCLILPNGNLLFLVGDITGHGVGSALIMAFSRAITFHWSQGEKLTPENLADEIDLMLRKNTTERMFMGIICGILEPDTGKISIVVKGHVYPLLIKENMPPQWVGTPSYPLGIGKKATKAKSQVITLEPGNRLLCLTDGIIEGINSANQVIGFETIEKWTSEPADSAENWIKSIEEKYYQWCDNKQLDDISMFALIKEGDSDEKV
jgi:sigma-B regulation protein RsbU (phosphoserine phosphatase)